MLRIQLNLFEILILAFVFILIALFVLYYFLQLHTYKKKALQLERNSISKLNVDSRAESAHLLTKNDIESQIAIAEEAPVVVSGSAPNLYTKFTSMLQAGLVVSLHTTKGPRPIILSLVGDEVRWQAVKSVNKRYKLNLKDVIRIEKGKITANFAKDNKSDEKLCFSLVTLKTTLDLEVNTSIDRDCFVAVFKKKLEEINSRPPQNQ